MGLSKTRANAGYAPVGERANGRVETHGGGITRGPEYDATADG